MRILLAGALSWNPERLRALHERGHRLFGLWSRSMSWDQGPYPSTDDCIRQVTLEDAPDTIRRERIDCVYSLLQVYDPKTWGPASPGVRHDVWTILGRLLEERARGAFDVPVVRHFGFDVHDLDAGVVRALDGLLVCNREKLDYWSAPPEQGGCGLALLAARDDVDFLDSDRPKLEFMNDRVSEPLSDADGEIHTVCIGRPFGIGYVAAARRGIHVHLYGNAFDDVHLTVARDLAPGEARRNAALLGRYLHVHPPLQAVGADWPEVRRIKNRWVEEFSRYDAAWSYLGSPFSRDPLDDRAAVPNRVGTYLLAGLPVITDRRPGSYRYEELVRLGVDVELVDGDYDGLRSRLEAERRTRERRGRALEQRHAYSFDATIDALLAALEHAGERYFARPHAERSHFAPSSPEARVRFSARLGPGGAGRGVPPLLGSQLSRRRRLWRSWRARRVRRTLAASGREPATGGEAAAARIAVLERFADPSRRCDPERIGGPQDEMVVWSLDGLSANRRALVRALPHATAEWLTSGALVGRRRRLLLACLRTGGARAAAVVRGPELCRRARGGEVDRVACFSRKGFGLARYLAEELDTPCEELLARGTRYFGEFAFELLAVVPYAYWLHVNGRLEHTAAAEDTGCLYYFSPSHEELPVQRRYVPVTEYPLWPEGLRRWDRLAFPQALDTREWLPPPYREVYADGRFRWERETCVVCNKTSEERYLRRGPVVNTLDHELLLEVVGRLRTRYQVVYDRPRAADIVNDRQPVHEPGDIEALTRAYPDVLTVQELHARHPELGFNELQLRLFAGCERFVSVLGGSSYLASYFGGTNVVYARHGREVTAGAYARWFDRFSGARVAAAGTPRELLRAIERELL